MATVIAPLPATALPARWDGRLNAGGSVEIVLPDEADRATVRVTVDQPSAPGYANVSDAATGDDGRSCVNFTGPTDVVNGVKTVELTSDRKAVLVTIAHASARVVVDVEVLENYVESSGEPGPPGPPGAFTDFPGKKHINSFPGSSLDARFGAAIAEVAAVKKPNHPFDIWFPDRIDWGTLTTKRNVPQGFRMNGVDRPAWQQRSINSYPNNLNVNAAEFLRAPDGDMWNADISGFGFTDTRSDGSVFLAGGTGTNVWCSHIGHASAFLSFKHVLGTPQQKLLTTFAHFFGGGTYINNARHEQFNLGGSEIDLFELGGGMDYNPAIRLPAGASTAPFECLGRIDNLGKTRIGPAFVTAEGEIAAYIITGSRVWGAQLAFFGGRIEGRNPSQPSFGPLVWINGAAVEFHGVWLAHAMANPTKATKKGGRGYIHVSGGAQVSIFGLGVDRANGVSEDVPIVYATGAGTRVIVNGVSVNERGGSWTKPPLVLAENGAKAYGDNTVRFS